MQQRWSAHDVAHVAVRSTIVAPRAGSCLPCSLYKYTEINTDWVVGSIALSIDKYWLKSTSEQADSEINKVILVRYLALAADRESGRHTPHL